MRFFFKGRTSLLRQFFRLAILSLDRPYDFTVKFGELVFSGNSGSSLDYLMLYLAKLAPRGVEFSLDFYGLVYEGHSHNQIDNSILMEGAYEKPILYLIRDVMMALAPDGGTFMDVGSNTGQHALFMSQ